MRRSEDTVIHLPKQPSKADMNDARDQAKRSVENRGGKVVSQTFVNVSGRPAVRTVWED